MKEQLLHLAQEHGAHGLWKAVLEVLKEIQPPVTENETVTTDGEPKTCAGGCPKNWVCNTDIGQCVPGL